MKIFLILLLSISTLFARDSVLVTGGAGYIGTQTCKALYTAGFFPIVYDNLSNGHAEAVKWGTFERGDIADRARLLEVMDKHHPIAVVHVAAFKAVGESVKDPAKYYRNNVCGSITLLDAMREKGIDKIIFSSTAATYGIPGAALPLTEISPCAPINPYGTSKLMIEKAIEDFSSAYNFRYVIFRYFNVAGADLDGECGEMGSQPQNLIPIVLQVASGRKPILEIFGNDYPTPDGTCVRDYIHVADLADAHVKGLQHILSGYPSILLNLGTGTGATVQEVVNAARSITHREIPTKITPRRPGDPPFLTADPSLAKEVLGWEPIHSSLQEIIETEWNWVQSLELGKS